MHLFIFLLFFTACAPKLQIYSPPLPPLALCANEKELNALLKTMDAASVVRTTKAHPHFLSLRVRLLLLENLVELGSYQEALILGEELLKIPSRPEKIPPPKNRKGSQRKLKVAAETNSSVKMPSESLPNISKKSRSSQGALKKPVRGGSQKKLLRKTLKDTKAKPEYLSESQKHKVYFYLALACQALKMREKALFYFEKTRERPNYFYLYRYSQAEKQEGNFTKALMLLEESYECSSGRFTYINEAYAFALTQEAFRIYKRKPQEAKAKLSLVLGDKNLSLSPSAARAEILWRQWF